MFGGLGQGARPLSKGYSLTDTSTSVPAGGTKTIRVVVGSGYNSGTFFIRSAVSTGITTPGVAASAYGNIKFAASEYSCAIIAQGPYTSGATTMVDAFIVYPLFSNGGTGLRLNSVAYDYATGAVQFTFQNTTGGALTLNVKITGFVNA